MDRVHADRGCGGRHMCRMHSHVHIDPRVQERRDGRQPNVLVRVDCRYVANVRQRGSVRRAEH